MLDISGVEPTNDTQEAPEFVRIDNAKSSRITVYGPERDHADPAHGAELAIRRKLPKRNPKEPIPGLNDWLAVESLYADRVAFKRLFDEPLFLVGIDQRPFKGLG